MYNYILICQVKNDIYFDYYRNVLKTSDKIFASGDTYSAFNLMAYLY